MLEDTRSYSINVLLRYEPLHPVLPNNLVKMRTHTYLSSSCSSPPAAAAPKFVAVCASSLAFYLSFPHVSTRSLSLILSLTLPLFRLVSLPSHFIFHCPFQPHLLHHLAQTHTHTHTHT